MMSTVMMPMEAACNGTVVARSADRPHEESTRIRKMEPKKPPKRRAPGASLLQLAVSRPPELR